MRAAGALLVTAACLLAAAAPGGAAAAAQRTRPAQVVDGAHRRKERSGSSVATSIWAFCRRPE